jgi:sulfur-carrier protein
VPVTFHIPSALRRLIAGESQVSLAVSPHDVRGALDALFEAHPILRDRILTETGQVREHINIFVGPEAIRWTGGLTTAVPEGAEISIIPAVSGGVGSPLI